MHASNRKAEGVRTIEMAVGEKIRLLSFVHASKEREERVLNRGEGRFAVHRATRNSYCLLGWFDYWLAVGYDVLCGDRLKKRWTEGAKRKVGETSLHLLMR